MTKMKRKSERLFAGGAGGGLRGHCAAIETGSPE
jgi:hypothetical protein